MTALALNTGLAQPELADLLDCAHVQFLQGQVRSAFRCLGQPLSDLRDMAIAEGRVEAAKQAVLSHPLYSMVQEDPYTRRARDKPRGYAGDAVMLDYVYAGVPEAHEPVSEMGEQVFRATTRGPMGLSVLFRRSLLQAHINDAVARRDDARILSVASGHCRELVGSLIESTEFCGSFTAFDQDPESCAEVQRAYAGYPVEVICSSVRALLAGGHQDLESYDLIYSAGLYDYLPEALALRLTRQLAARLAPGGRLLIANFTRDGQGRAYMEWFMDWELVLRSEAALRALVQSGGPGAVSSFVDPHGNVAYAVYSAP